MIKIFLILTTFSTLTASAYGQINGPELSGMLKLEEVKIYWDKAETQVRSVGYYRVNGASSVGEKFGKWKFYYRDGKLEEKCNYYDGKLNGEVKQYYPNGHKKFRGYFYLGVPDSSFMVYHENGKLAEEGVYKSIPDSILDNPLKYWNTIEFITAKKIGTWKSYYDSGEPWKEVRYKPGDSLEYLIKFFGQDGKMQVSEGNGTVKEFSTLKKPRLEMSYKNGLKNGPYKRWNANNTLRESGAYKDNLQTGEWNLFMLKSGKLYQKVNYIEGKRDGPFVEYMPNDTLALKGSYKFGEKDGLWKYYFENGQLDMTGNFDQNLQEGHWKYFYMNGDIYYEGDFEKGEKTGHWVFFYNNKQLWREGDYRHDKKDGPWNFFYEDGTPLMNGGFSEDVEHGAWESFYANGQDKDRGSYDHGKMTASWKGWYPNGKLKYEGQYAKDKRTGSWLFYTDKGKLREQGEFKILKAKTSNDEIGYNFVLNEERSYKHGNWKTYSEKDNKLSSQGSYNRGRQSGTWKYYYPGGKVITYENSYNASGQLSGVSRSYSRRGNTISEVHYKNGKKHGDVKTYDRKGNLIQHVVYKNGVKSKDIINKTSYKYKKGKKK